MVKLVNRAKMTTATTGTGTITLGSAVNGYQTFAAAGVASGDTVRYVIEDGANWEIGTGTFNGTTLTRTVIESSNADAAISLSGQAVVFVSMGAADIGKRENSTFYIYGTGTASGVWTGSHPDITEYYEGLQIKFHLNIAGASTTTLNINGLGAKTVYLYGATKLTTHYPVGTVLDMTYTNANGGSFNTDMYYDTTDDYRIRWQNNVTAGALIHGYQLLLEGMDGKFYPVTEGGVNGTTNTVSTAAFKPQGTMLYYDTSTDIAANAQGGGYSLYESLYTSTMEYWSNRSTTAWATAGLPVYLVGTINSSGAFILDNSTTTSFLTQNLPTSADGKVYMQVGIMVNTSDLMRLPVNHPMFEYKDGAVRPYAYDGGNQTITLSGDLTGSGTTSISAQIAANVVGANELNVSGNGTTSQYLRSDGDGSFTWATPPDTNTTYAAGSGLTLVGTVFSHADTSAQASVNNSGRTYIQAISLDTYGHVTAITSATETVTDTNTTSLPIENSSGVVQFTATDVTGLQFAGSGAASVAFDAANYRVTISSTDTDTTYSAGNGISLSGTTFSVAAGGGLTQETSGLAHADTSTQASINNSNGVVIQDVTLDGYGHVTGLASIDLDGRYYTETESNARYLRKDTNDTSVGYIAAEGFVNTGTGSLSIFNPHNANYATTTATVTGAIKITLPVSWTNTMLRMTIRIYEYATNEGFDVVCGGYNATSPNWINPFAYILGNPNVNRNFNVRFGHDGTKCCIYIGETTSTWSYPQVAVTQLVAGYSNYGAETWNDGWDIGFATTLGTIYATISNSEIGRYVDGGTVWHSGNDGSGSGLDADTLDGQHASAFLTGNQTITLSGDLTGSGTTSINAQIAANAVGANELNVTGNGTTAQYLRSDGDGSFTWDTPTAPAPTTAQVLSATAGASVGDVGTYAWLVTSTTGSTDLTQGSTIAGSSTRYYGHYSNTLNDSGLWSYGPSNPQPSGTWRVMGYVDRYYNTHGHFLALRIS